jgi:hypothetical protein
MLDDIQERSLACAKSNPKGLTVIASTVRSVDSLRPRDTLEASDAIKSTLVVVGIYDLLICLSKLFAFGFATLKCCQPKNN